MIARHIKTSARKGGGRQVGGVVVFVSLEIAGFGRSKIA